MESEKQQCFRFFDLPGEIRNLVYSYACIAEPRHAARLCAWESSESQPYCDEGRQALAKVKIPAICRDFDSRMGREALSVFFTENKFSLNVYSNFADGHAIRSGIPNQNFCEGCWQRSGRLRIRKPCVWAALRHAAMRDVSINVLEARHSWDEQNKDYRKWLLKFTLDLIFDGETCSVRTEEKEHRAFLWFDLPRYKAEIAIAIKACTAAAERVGARAGFDGFTFKDLEMIAVTLRFPAPPPRQAADLARERELGEVMRRLQVLRLQASRQHGQDAV
ncbi:hypothetical protein AC579_3933 [Pseudocercospora musae]|uniref:Uncharacterized protein n=1 Tax=Pseudocercospora musae TaxID=113226 RepID=A0A139IKW3_9PEZI|nr:hypothetical protein AC579_3933 [Pseudocercospora musae]